MTDPAEARTSILPLLKSLSTSRSNISPEEITEALTHSFNDALSPVQTGALLTALHFTGLDQKAEIIAAAAKAMRGKGVKIDGLENMPRRKEGEYYGGLVDIVGTGGDGHNTFNVSTTAAILASGSGLRICKHGNKASTSTSGSADILTSLGASLTSINSQIVTSIFTTKPQRNFCFLYAPVFHPAMKYVAGIRKELGYRTIFNLLGPLVNPVDYSLREGLEARVIGVGKRELGSVFAETLILLGVKKGLVVCGTEGLDEISCERETECWRVYESDGKVKTNHFLVHPTKTFGLQTHPLASVAGGKSPDENARILRRLLNGQGTEEEKAIEDFVLVNAAALIVVSGILGEVEVINEGEVVVGDIWKRGVERAREGIRSGRAWTEWEGFVKMSQIAGENM